MHPTISEALAKSRQLRLTAETITQALRDGDQEAGQAGQEHTDHTEESDT
jgi:hypothetical protein